MRLEKHDVEVLLPVGLGLLSKSGNLIIKNLSYCLEQDSLLLKGAGTYGGLPVSLDLALSFFVKGGALGMNIEKGYLDSLIMKGDVVPFLKTMLKNNANFCVEERTVYFYHPKMNIQSFSVDQTGIELTFK